LSRRSRGVEERAAALASSSAAAATAAGDDGEAKVVVEAQGEEVTDARQLQIIETLHKVLVLYLWLGNRAPAAYHQTEQAFALKTRVERALDVGLQSMSWRRAAKGKGKARVPLPPSVVASAVAATGVGSGTEAGKIQWSRLRAKSGDDEKRELAVKRARVLAERQIEMDSEAEVYSY